MYSSISSSGINQQAEDDHFFPSPKSSIASSPLAFPELPCTDPIRLSNSAPLASTINRQRLSLLSPFPPIIGTSDASIQLPMESSKATAPTTALFLRHTSSSQLRLQTRQNENANGRLSITSSHLHYSTSPTSAAIRDPSPARSMLSTKNGSNMKWSSTSNDTSSVNGTLSNASRTKRSGAPSTFSCPTLSSSPKVVKRLPHGDLEDPIMNRRPVLSAESTKESITSISSAKSNTTKASVKKLPIKPPLSKRGAFASESRFSLHQSERAKSRSVHSSPSRSPKRSFIKSPKQSPPAAADASSRPKRLSVSRFSSHEGMKRMPSGGLNAPSISSNCGESSTSSLPGVSPDVPPTEVEMHITGEALKQEEIPGVAIPVQRTTSPLSDAHQQSAPARGLSLNIKSVRATLDAFHFDSSRSQESKRAAGVKPVQQSCQHAASHVSSIEESIRPSTEKAQSSGHTVSRDTLAGRANHATISAYREGGEKTQDGESLDSCGTTQRVADLFERWRSDTEHLKQEMRGLTDAVIDKLKGVAHHYEQIRLEGETKLVEAQLACHHHHPNPSSIESTMVKVVHNVLEHAVDSAVLPGVEEAITATLKEHLEANFINLMSTVDQLVVGVEQLKEEGRRRDEKLDQLLRGAQQNERDEKLEGLIRAVDQLTQQQQFILQQQVSSQPPQTCQMPASEGSNKIRTPLRDRNVPGARISSSSVTGRMMGSGKRGIDRSGGRGGVPSGARSQWDTPCSFALTDSMTLSESRMTLMDSNMSFRNSSENPVGGGGGSAPGVQTFLNSSTTKSQVVRQQQSDSEERIFSSDSIGRDVSSEYENVHQRGLFNEDRYQNLLSYGDDSGRHAFGTNRNAAGTGKDNHYHYHHQHRTSYLASDEDMFDLTPTNHRTKFAASPRSAPTLRRPKEAPISSSIEFSLDDSILDLTGCDESYMEQRSGMRDLHRHYNIHPDHHFMGDSQFENDPLSLSTSNMNDHRLNTSEFDVSELQASKLGTIPEVDSSQGSDTSAFLKHHNNHLQRSTSTNQTSNQSIRYKQSNTMNNHDVRGDLVVDVPNTNVSFLSIPHADQSVSSADVNHSNQHCHESSENSGDGEEDHQSPNLDGKPLQSFLARSSLSSGTPVPAERASAVLTTNKT